MSQVLEIIDFDAICRICWCSSNLQSVFNPEIPSYCEMLMALAPVEVCEENGLPTQICEECRAELTKVFEFRSKCIESDQKLKQYLSDNGIVTTVQYLHDPETDETIETIRTTVAFDEANITEQVIPDQSEKDNEERHDCTECSKSYSLRRNLKRHIKQSHCGEPVPTFGNRIFRCGICQRLFSFRNALIRHLRIIHKEITQRYFVNIKGKTCCTSGINLFIEKAGEETNEVKGIFGDIENREEEIEEETKPTVQLMEEDNQTVFVVSQDLMQKIIKLEEQPDFCDSSSDEAINEESTSKTKYKCEYCLRSYFAKNNLTRHMKEKHLPPQDIIRNYKCHICGRSFARKGLLERHAETHFERVAYQCEQCGEVFDKKIKLRYHVQKHDTQKKFQCDVCSKWFLRASTLRVHKKQHEPVLPYPCPDCDRAFSMRPALEAHVRTHSESRPYVCEICRRAFRHPGHLETHMKLHTGDRKYPCTICSKRFTTSTHLKYHIKVHLDQREFKCEICNRGFIHNSELKYHMLTHTQVKECPCPICGKMFARTNQVTKHMKQVHNVKKNFYAT